MSRTKTSGTKIRWAGREWTVGNLDKLYWPQEGITKRDYLAYCLRMADVLIPYLRDRPLVVTRYPDGVEGKFFYQKDAPTHTPVWVRRIRVWSGDSKRWIRYILCNDTATLIWLAGQGVLEFHPWLSRADEMEKPDLAVVDLDPSQGADFHQAVEVALGLRELLHFLGLRGYPKTTGKTGIHVYIPIRPVWGYRRVAEFIKRIGIFLAVEAPQSVTLERAVARRRGVYVDYLQNGRGKTLVSPYSTRPHPAATVSFPVDWEELKTIRPDDFTLQTVPNLVERNGDRFEALRNDPQSLDEPWSRLETLLRERRILTRKSSP
ncbi:MAG: non-homologous end-joining DNA ligase [Planifilum fulgidum]